MPKALRKYIEINPQILGGAPVISGTRIPIEKIYQLIKQGHSVENLQEEYPWVDKKKILFTVAILMKAGLDEFEKAYKAQATAR
jgi:uncharacterized protein (DUF433 family)